MEDLSHSREILTTGAEFQIAYHGKTYPNYTVWLSSNLSSVLWAETRKSWRYHEKSISGEITFDSDHGIVIPVVKGDLILSSANGEVLKDWANALRNRPKLLGTSTPFNVQHHSHVGTNMEWTGDISSLFIVEEFLGKGSFGSVHRVRHRDSGAVMAAKLVIAENSDEIKKEIDILRKCKHGCVVAYYGCGSEPDCNGDLWILMDYCDGRDVGVLLDNHGPLPEPVIQYIMLQAFRATGYLHAKGIMHRDIKSGNILLTSNGDVKLGDFGVSKVVSASVANGGCEIAGSPLWMAPEVIKGKPVSFSSDIWSLGITAIELAEGSPPRSGLSVYQAMKAICKENPPELSHPEKWSSPFRQFCQACLVTDPLTRPSAIDMLSHPFLASIGKNEDKLKVRLKAVLNQKRRTSSLGSKLKDMKGRAERVISRGAQSHQRQQNEKLEEQDGDSDEEDDDDDAQATAVFKGSVDDDEIAIERVIDRVDRSEEKAAIVDAVEPERVSDVAVVNEVKVERPGVSPWMMALAPGVVIIGAIVYHIYLSR